LGQPSILEWALTDETEAAAFTNLLTLGFDPMLMERKHVTSFDRRMLCKTNAKGMEIVIHLLSHEGPMSNARKSSRSSGPSMICLASEASASSPPHCFKNSRHSGGVLCLRCHATVHPLHSCTHAHGRAHRTYLLSSVAPEEWALCVVIIRSLVVVPYQHLCSEPGSCRSIRRSPSRSLRVRAARPSCTCCGTSRRAPSARQCDT
jgi:hypothetical protein